MTLLLLISNTDIIINIIKEFTTKKWLKAK